MSKRRGEIVTVLTVGAFVVLTVASLISSIFINQNKQTTKTSAETMKCPGGSCDHCGQGGWWDQGCFDKVPNPPEPTDSNFCRCSDVNSCVIYNAGSYVRTDKNTLGSIWCGNDCRIHPGSTDPITCGPGVVPPVNTPTPAAATPTPNPGNTGSCCGCNKVTDSSGKCVYASNSMTCVDAIQCPASPGNTGSCCGCNKVTDNSGQCVYASNSTTCVDAIQCPASNTPTPNPGNTGSCCGCNKVTDSSGQCVYASYSGACVNATLCPASNTPIPAAPQGSCCGCNKVIGASGTCVYASNNTTCVDSGNCPASGAVQPAGSCCGCNRVIGANGGCNNASDSITCVNAFTCPASNTPTPPSLTTPTPAAVTAALNVCPDDGVNTKCTIRTPCANGFEVTNSLACEAWLQVCCVKSDLIATIVPVKAPIVTKRIEVDDKTSTNAWIGNNQICDYIGNGTLIPLSLNLRNCRSPNYVTDSTNGKKYYEYSFSPSQKTVECTLGGYGRCLFVN